jgi:hypothetical protein
MASTATKAFAGLGCGCLLTVLFVLYTCGSFMRESASRSGSYKDTDPIGFEIRTEAWELCKKDVLRRLKAPATAEFVDEDRGYKRVFIEDLLAKAPPRKRKKFEAVDKKLGVKEHLLVQGSVDAQNSFGAKLRTSFDCRLLQLNNGQVVIAETTLY